MARKQSRTFLPAEGAAAPVPTKRERHPRPKTTQPVETAAADTRTEDAVAEPAAAPSAAPPVSDDEEIARIAYSYFEARGYQHGSDEEDWLRAEQEYRSRKQK